MLNECQQFLIIIEDEQDGIFHSQCWEGWAVGEHPWCEPQLLSSHPLHKIKSYPDWGLVLLCVGFLNFDLCAFAVIFLPLPLLFIYLHTLAEAQPLLEAFPDLLPLGCLEYSLALPCLSPHVILIFTLDKLCHLLSQMAAILRA